MKSSAYSLVEILVAISIIAIIVVIGYANYRDFARRQASISYARTLEADLRDAQALALSGNKPPPAQFDCYSSGDSFSGIRLNLNTNTKYTITAVCSNNEESQPIKIVNLPAGVSMVRPSKKDVIFKTVARGTDLTTDMVIKVCALNRGTVVSVSPSGEINEYLADSCP